MWNSWDAGGLKREPRKQNGHRRMIRRGTWGSSENRRKLFVLPLPLTAGVTLCQVAQCLLATYQAKARKTCWEIIIFKKKKKGRKWGRLGRGRIAVNTSSNDLHNIQPYSSLACSPTLGSLFWLTTFLWTSETLYSHSPETPVDPHIWCYHNKQWSSSNSHKRMQATRTHTHTHSQTFMHTQHNFSLSVTLFLLVDIS